MSEDKIASKGHTQKKIIILGILIVMIAGWFNLLDKSAKTYLGDTMGSLIGTYAAARTTNGLISTLQSVEVTGSIKLVEASVELGQILDPLNDSVERFSDFIGVAIGSTFFQILLLELISTTLYKVLLTLSGLFLIGSIFINSNIVKHIALKSFIFLAVMRISISLLVLMTWAVDDFFIEERTAYNTNEIKKSNQELMESAVAEAKRVQGLVDKNEILIERNTVLSSLIQELERDIKTAEKPIVELQEEIELLDEGFFSKDTKELVDKKEKLEILMDEQDLRIESLEEYREELHDNIAEIEDNKNEIEDGPGLVSKVFAGAKSLVTYVSEVDLNLIGRTAENYMQLMIIWAIKTIALPLLFLFLFLKFFKGVWGIRFDDYVKQEYHFVKSSLPSKGKPIPVTKD